MDPACAAVLQKRFGNVEVHPDVVTLRPPVADVVAGGWPCQDISVAGLQQGLLGKRSSLFYAMVDVAKEAKAHTIVAENVPNLLVLQGGKIFSDVLEKLNNERFPFISWRTINARQFGLPHQRERIFIVASKHPEIARALHRPFEPAKESAREHGHPSCSGFYWTGGSQSICYSRGYVPTLKVGSSLSIPSPPAIHFENVVRKASPAECLRLQGFDPNDFDGMKPNNVYRMTGNAVALPVGQFVMDSIKGEAVSNLESSALFFTKFESHGFYQAGTVMSTRHSEADLATNLDEFIDVEDRKPLSQRASRGLLHRLVRSGNYCPPDLFELLCDYAETSPKAMLAMAPHKHPSEATRDLFTEQRMLFGESAG